MELLFLWMEGVQRGSLFLYHELVYLMMSNILFAIESISRELDYKLLLACMLLTKDRVVYIGQHDYSFFMSKYMNGGVYLGKNFLQKKMGVGRIGIVF